MRLVLGVLGSMEERGGTEEGGMLTRRNVVKWCGKRRNTTFKDVGWWRNAMQTEGNTKSQGRRRGSTEKKEKDEDDVLIFCLDVDLMSLVFIKNQRKGLEDQETCNQRKNKQKVIEIKKMREKGKVIGGEGSRGGPWPRA